MNTAKQKALEAAGWKVGDAAEFLEMTDDERQLLDVRFELAMAIRKHRKAIGLSQKELGIRLKTSQPRVVKIENAASDVSLDQMVRALNATGGRLVVRHAPPKAKPRKHTAQESPNVILELITEN